MRGLYASTYYYTYTKSNRFYVKGITPLAILSNIFLEQFIADQTHTVKSDALGIKIEADVVSGADVDRTVTEYSGQLFQVPVGSTD